MDRDPLARQDRDIDRGEKERKEKDTDEDGHALAGERRRSMVLRVVDRGSFR